MSKSLKLIRLINFADEFNLDAGRLIREVDVLLEISENISKFHRCNNEFFIPNLCDGYEKCPLKIKPGSSQLGGYCTCFVSYVINVLYGKMYKGNLGLITRKEAFDILLKDIERLIYLIESLENEK